MKNAPIYGKVERKFDAFCAELRKKAQNDPKWAG